MKATIIPRVRPVWAVTGQGPRDVTGTRAARLGSGIWLRLFEVTLALFLASYLLTDVYPWLPSFNRLLGAGLALLAIGSWLRRRRGVPAEVVLFGAFVAWGVLTGFLFAWDQSRVLAYGKLLSQELVLAFALTEYVRERGTPTFPFLLLLVVPLCMYWYARANGQLVTAQAGGRGESWRLMSFTANPNYAGFLCLYGLFGVAYFLWNRKKQGLVFWPLLVLPFTGITLVLSGSRGSTLVAGFFALAWVSMAYARAMASRFRTALILLMVVAGVFFAGRFIMESTFVGKRFDRAVRNPRIEDTRFRLYEEGWMMFTNAAIQGVGLGNFGIHSATATYAHSDMMEVLATTGIVGFVLYCSIYVVLWRRLRRILKAHADPTSRYMVGLYQAMITALMLLGLETPNFLNPLYLVLVGVMVGHTRAMEHDLYSSYPAEGGTVTTSASQSRVALRRAPRFSV